MSTLARSALLAALLCSTPPAHAAERKAGRSEAHRFDGHDEGCYREPKGAFEWALENGR